MKPYLFFLILAWSMLPRIASAQLTNGSVSAFFGVDGDTRNNYVKYGPATGNIASDDWFSSTLSGKNVIDTTNASLYLSLLQSNSNLSFSQRMSVPLYSKYNGKLWLDAVYGRDYLGVNSLTDSTTFTIACKNGDNPSVWKGGSGKIPDKNDLVDVYAHMRRDGIDVHDSLWLFAGVSTVGTSGSRYFDVELYKKNFGYSSSTGSFSTAGADSGHTQWVFDASGNILQTGDMILAVNYSPGFAPAVDVRIWVSQTTFSTVVPANFNFGSSYSSGSTTAFGYASIVSKSGATAFGSGMANFSGTTSQDTTYSTPWGTEMPSKAWGTQYQSLQLVEIGLNLTRMGLDPALYSALGVNPCQSFFSNIFFKSRSSNSFTSNMQDFVGPLDFLRAPVMDYSLQPDTLRCNRTTGAITITNNTTNGYYTWQTANGNISGSSADSSTIAINKPGTYIVSASPAMGCPATRKDTVVIPIDTSRPVAAFTATLGANNSYIQFYGGDVAASNYSTPFGGSKGLLWNWSGPGSFTSTIQNPTNDTIWGTYQLVVTEKRNGCTDTAVHTLNSWDFIVLPNMAVILRGALTGKAIMLTWDDQNHDNTAGYEIEKLVNGNFISIGKTYGNQSFADNDPAGSDNIYRIKATNQTGRIVYSNIIRVKADAPKIYLVRVSGNTASMVCNTDRDCVGTVALYNLSGQMLNKMSVNLRRGSNTIDLPLNSSLSNSCTIISLRLNDQGVFARKLLQ